MKILKWVIIIFVTGMTIFFLWPTPAIIPQKMNYLAQIPTDKLSRIVLVYNANADKISVLKDFFIKEFTPSDYPCNLCRITFGTFTMKTEWKQFLDSLPLKKEFLHKDEFAKKYALSITDFPAIFVGDENNLALLISRAELNKVHTLQALQQLVLQKLTY